MADLGSGDDKLVGDAVRSDAEGTGEEEVSIERIEKVYK